MSPSNRQERADASPPAPLAPLDYHVLLVLAAGRLYGYAIMKEVESQTEGAVRVEIGSLYRVIGRLMESGWVEEVDPPARAPMTHRGQPRRYYAITAEGRTALRAEAQRLARVVRLTRRVLPGSL